jgi:hypothetical protein
MAQKGHLRIELTPLHLLPYAQTIDFTGIFRIIKLISMGLLLQSYEVT